MASICIFIWQIVLKTWRYWWVDEYSSLYCDNNITITELLSIFDNKTKDMFHLDKFINRYTLLNLRDACNKYLIPIV